MGYQEALLRCACWAIIYIKCVEPLCMRRYLPGMQQEIGETCIGLHGPIG